MIRILGIDPGLAQTGYGVIEVSGSSLRCIDYGTIRTDAGIPTGKRLSKLFEEISSLIESHAPREGGVESLYFAKNSATALPVAQAKGVVLLAMERSGVRVREYPPQAIKQAVAGNGRANKVQVQELVRLLLGMDRIPEPDHASDALAAAICHFHFLGVEDCIARAAGRDAKS